MNVFSVCSCENPSRWTVSPDSTVPGSGPGYVGMKYGWSMHGWPSIALSRFAARVKWSISSKTTDPMSPAISLLSEPSE